MLLVAMIFLITINKYSYTTVFTECNQLITLILVDEPDMVIIEISAILPNHLKVDHASML